MRVWLTRGYSLARIASIMRAALPGHEVLVSAVAAPGLVEPDPVDEPAYLEYVRETVAAHNIDVLVPTRRAAAVTRAGAGCRIEAAAPADVLELLHDKLAFAEALVGDPLLAPTLAVRGVDDFERGIDHFAARDTPCCIKPARGVNGIGYQRFTDRARLAQLAEPELRETRVDTFARALREAETDGVVPPHALMEFLPGDEISVDALAWHGRLLGHAARTKSAETVQLLSTRHALEPEVRRLVERFELHGLVSVQFRRDAHGVPRLLEINPRPAGGCLFSEAAGCALVRDWARLLVGEMEPDEVRTPHLEATLHRETHVRVQHDVPEGARCAA